MTRSCASQLRVILLTRYARLLLDRTEPILSKALQFQKNFFNTFKRMSPMTFPRNSWSSLVLPRSNFNYREATMNGRNSSLLMAVVGWVARELTEAPVLLWELDTDGTHKRVIQQDMVRLLERPNPFYFWQDMIMALGIDIYFSGNGYLIKRRNMLGKVVQLWWVPSITMEPCWVEDPTPRDKELGRDFISHYEYKPDPSLDSQKIDRNDVIHVRWSIDERNVRKGIAPLQSLLREVFTDEEAANYTASILRNMGVPGVILAPSDNETTEPMSDEDVESVKRSFMQRFGGDRRGEPMVMDTKLDVHIISFSPEQMNLRRLRQIPEERVSAVSGVHSIVVGFGSGTETSTTSFGSNTVAPSAGGTDLNEGRSGTTSTSYTPCAPSPPRPNASAPAAAATAAAGRLLRRSTFTPGATLAVALPFPR